MIPAKYRPRHEPNCDCVVCWAHAFHQEMMQRNEDRAERCRQILKNPEQSNFFTALDEVSQ